MTPGEFAAIEARANAASAGPWEVRPESDDWAVISSGPDSVIHAYRDDEPCDSCGDNPGVLEAKVSISIEDAEFIAHAREDIPALLAAVRESERSLETQKKVADTFRQCLTDTYRPHVEENKMLRDLISHYDPMLRERDNTIARVRARIDSAEQIAEALDFPRVVLIDTLRAALDSKEGH